MGLPNVVYNWKSLRILYITIFIMNIAGLLIVVIMIVSAVRLRLGLGQYLDLIEPGEGNIWPGIIFLAGFICAPIYAIGLRLCLHLRYILSDTLPRLNNVLFVHCLLCLASTILIAGLNAGAIIHMVNLNPEADSEHGIIEAMKRYATEIMSKVRIDAVQMNFGCCGSKSFKDWFLIPWTDRNPETNEARDHNGSHPLSTDVPFSCCATDLLIPCIHQNIMKPSEVFQNRPEHGLTISTSGCHAKVLSHARYVSALITLGLILLALYQIPTTDTAGVESRDVIAEKGSSLRKMSMVLAVLSRLLQTTHSNVLYIGPRRNHYLGWILGSMPSPETYERLIHGSADEAGFPMLEETEKSLCEESCEEFESSKTPDLVVSTEGLVEEEQKSSTCSWKQPAIPTPPPSPTICVVGVNCPMQKSIERPQKNVAADKRSTPDFITPKKIKNKLKRTRTASSSSAVGLSRNTTNSAWKLKDMRASLECRVSESGFDAEDGRTDSSSSSSGQKSRSRESMEEEDEIRLKKFCRELSTEYKMSPYSQQRRDVSEPRSCRITDDGRSLRSRVCARFNPSDAYGRFRGSVQDTMMRRGTQRPQETPPPIPISGVQRPLRTAGIPRQSPGSRPPIPTYVPIPRPPVTPICPRTSGGNQSSRRSVNCPQNPHFHETRFNARFSNPQGNPKPQRFNER